MVLAVELPLGLDGVRMTRALIPYWYVFGRDGEGLAKLCLGMFDVEECG